MFDKLNQAKQMAEGIKAKLETIRVTGEAEGITVLANGNRKVLEVNIPETLLNSNSKEQVQDLLCVAINRALAAAENVSEAEMRGMMGSMMPGLGGLFK
jgi:DNA-binding protein YbaB